MILKWLTNWFRQWKKQKKKKNVQKEIHLIPQSGTMIKFLPLDVLGVSHRILWKYKNAVYCLQISALVPAKMCKICKWDDWWCHTVNPILYQVYK